MELKKAGADWYACYQETHNRELFGKLRLEQDYDARWEAKVFAKAAGLLALHVSPEMGGLGLSHVEKAVVFEAAGYSMLGPVAIHAHAPDEGNIHLLEVVATPAQ